MSAVFSLWQHCHSKPTAQTQRLYSSDNNYYDLSRFDTSNTTSKTKTQVRATPAVHVSGDGANGEGQVPNNEIYMTREMQVERGRPESLG